MEIATKRRRKQENLEIRLPELLRFRLGASGLRVIGCSTLRLLGAQSKIRIYGFSDESARSGAGVAIFYRDGGLSAGSPDQRDRRHPYDDGKRLRLLRKRLPGVAFVVGAAAFT